VSGALKHVACEQAFSSSRLEQVFAACFAARWRTRLVGGAQEPLYQPATTDDDLHLLHYRLDYFASALHETAHWCIAGERRRRLCDFGYWYHADGRSLEKQREFEQVESRPQALEWFFSRACGYRFRVSSDNLGAPEEDHLCFKQAVVEQARHWERVGLPERAGLFFRALAESFGTGARPAGQRFELEELL